MPAAQPTPGSDPCNKMVSGGMMSFPCILQRGHEFVLDDDPEPHFIKESAGVNRMWQAWRTRQDQREALGNSVVDSTGAAQQQWDTMASLSSDDHQSLLVCPKCDERSLKVEVDTATCLNESCDFGPAEVPVSLRTASPNPAPTESFWPAGEQRPTVAMLECNVLSVRSMQHVAHYWTTPQESVDLVSFCGGIPLVQGEPWTPPTMKIRGEAQSIAVAYLNQAKQTSPVEIHFMRPDEIVENAMPYKIHLYDPKLAEPEPEMVAGWDAQGPVMLTPDEADGIRDQARTLLSQGPEPAVFPSDRPTITEEQADSLSAPTKQREGDQRLPSKGVGEVSVQDFIISTMEESKRVGTERYGQALMQFDGRSNIRDIHDEARDLFVYTGKMLQQGEADRVVLEQAVTKAIMERDPEMVQFEAEETARVSVGVILDWVIQKVHGGE